MDLSGIEDLAGDPFVESYDLLSLIAGFHEAARLLGLPIPRRRWQDPEYLADPSQVHQDLEDLLVQINRACPTGFYFGTYPGVSTAWAFWPEPTP